MTAHASSDVLARFVDDTLDGVERTSLEEHLDACDDCRSTVAMLIRAAVAERRASEPTLGTQPPEAFQPTELSPDRPARDRRAPLAPGTVVGRYELGEVLGAGGMGIVYAARDPELDRDIAIKLLRPELSRSDPDATRRVIREGQAMARIAHPNVVTVFDVGTFEGQVFIAMERITGTTLRAWLAAKPRRPAEIVEVFLGAGRGLCAAHDAGMVHRDFKPDNVLVGSDGRPRVTDFGLAFDERDAAVLDVSGDGQTRPIVGTPAYMAPEQHAGANVDARSDQFSFAVALYEALYGTRPFAGKGREELVAAMLAGTIQPPPARSDVPASLRDILERAIALKPGDRYASLADLLRALARDRGRRPRQIAQGALIGLAVVAVAFGADAIMRERTHAVTRTSFASARTQLDKLLELRTEAFVAQADAMYRLPIMQEVATSRDQADFGLGDAAEDRAHVERQHETLTSADWVGLLKTHTGDVVAIADHKGRLLFDSANTELWGGEVMKIAAIASAFGADTETYLGVVDANEPDVVASGLLGGVPHQKLYVAFARAKRIGARANAVFMQLVEAGMLLDQVGVGADTLLSVVTEEGVAEGHVPANVLFAVTGHGIDELTLDDGSWLAERAPLRARDQDSAIAQLVAARRTNLGLSGLFPHAQQTLGALGGVLAMIALAGFVVARRRDLGRRGAVAA